MGDKNLSRRKKNIRGKGRTKRKNRKLDSHTRSGLKIHKKRKVKRKINTEKRKSQKRSKRSKRSEKIRYQKGGDGDIPIELNEKIVFEENALIDSHRNDRRGLEAKPLEGGSLR